MIALTNARGGVARQYSYDQWGKPLLPTSGVALIQEAVPQPLRYRGYWYDGWYDGAGGYNGGTTYQSTNTRSVAWYWPGAQLRPGAGALPAAGPPALDGLRSYLLATCY